MRRRRKTRGGGSKGAYGGTWCIQRWSGRNTELATRALEHGVLGPDGTGLEYSLVETADESVDPALLDETTRGAGSDGPAAGGGRGTELDPVIPMLFQKDGSVTEEEKMEFWKEGPSGVEVELHAGFLAFTHRNDRPLVSGAAEKGGMVLLEEGAARRSRRYVLERGGRRFPPRDQRSVKCRGRRGKTEATE